MWQNKVEILLYIAKEDSIVIAGDRASLSSVVALCFIAIQYKFTVVYCESVNLIGYITDFYLLIETSYASVHIARNV